MFKILGIGTYLAVSLGVRAVTGFMGAYRCPRFSKGFKKMGTKEEHMENGPERSLGPERFQIPSRPRSKFSTLLNCCNGKIAQMHQRD